LQAQHASSTLTLEAKKQAHPVRSAAGHAGLSGDAADFYRRAVGAFWRPPCRPSMLQAPSPSRPKSRLIRRGRPQGMPGCPATLLIFTSGPKVFFFFFFFFFGVSRLQERNQASKCHPSKGPTRERCNLTDTTPRGAAQPSPRRMAMWATPSALPAESRIQGPAYAPVK
jgi:hypothetical protein